MHVHDQNLSFITGVHLRTPNAYKRMIQRISQHTCWMEIANCFDAPQLDEVFSTPEQPIDLGSLFCKQMLAETPAPKSRKTKLARLSLAHRVSLRECVGRCVHLCVCACMIWTKTHHTAYSWLTLQNPSRSRFSSSNLLLWSPILLCC